MEKSIPLQGAGEQSTKFGGPCPYCAQPPDAWRFENAFPPLESLLGCGILGAGLLGGGLLGGGLLGGGLLGGGLVRGGLRGRLARRQRPCPPPRHPLRGH